MNTPSINDVPLGGAAQPEANPTPTPTPQVPAGIPAGTPAPEVVPTATPAPEAGAFPEEPEKASDLLGGTPQEEKKEPAKAVELPYGTSERTAGFIESVVDIVDVQQVVELAQTAIKHQNTELLLPELFEHKFGENSKLALQLAKSIVQDTVDVVAQAKQRVLTSVGSEEAWLQLSQNFKAIADEGTTNAVKTLLDSNHIEAAVKFMQQVVGSSSQLPQEGKTVLGTPQAQGAGLSAEEFRAELAKLDAEFPNFSYEHPAVAKRYQELVNARQVGRNAGR